ncbi:MAG: hypothetical protein OXG37_02405 [Actinomycetia bacterium]|nr:hypothetical protein [Actinomycetes bacterium]
MLVRCLSIQAALAVPLLVAGCGSSSSAETEGARAGAGDSGVIVEGVERIPSEPARTNGRGSAFEVSLADFLLGRPGEDVAMVPGVSDLALGENRVTFLVLRGDASPVLSPTARVLVGRVDAPLAVPGEPDGFGDALKETPFTINPSMVDGTPLAETQARLITIGAAAGRAGTAADAPGESAPADETAAELDVEHLYVARVTFHEPGVYWLVAEPEGADVQALRFLQVRAYPVSPAVGDRAFPSENPTLDDAQAREITTQRPPAIELLRYSVKQSLEASVPFVVTFATPAFCLSRICGPVVDVLDEVRAELEGTGVRFIHIEIYHENDPARGINEWVQEWRLASEPWTFIVDGAGVIRDRFEGAFSSEELRRSIVEHLVDA